MARSKKANHNNNQMTLYDLEITLAERNKEINKKIEKEKQEKKEYEKNKKTDN